MLAFAWRTPSLPTIFQLQSLHFRCLLWNFSHMKKLLIDVVGTNAALLWADEPFSAFFFLPYSVARFAFFFPPIDNFLGNASLFAEIQFRLPAEGVESSFRTVALFDIFFGLFSFLYSFISLLLYVWPFNSSGGHTLYTFTIM